MTIYGTKEQCKKYPGFYKEISKEYKILLELKNYSSDYDSGRDSDRTDLLDLSNKVKSKNVLN